MEIPWILIAIIALIIVFAVIFFIRKPKEKFSTLAGFAFAFVIAGIIFGDNRLLGYSLMIIGIVLAIIDIFIKKNKKEVIEGGKDGKRKTRESKRDS